MSSNTGTCAAVRNAVTHGFAHVVALILAASAASTVAASTGPTVKEVVEFTRIVQPMHHDQDALQEQRSPDGQKAFIVTRQSNVQTDRNRFEILLLDLNVQRLREKRALPPKPLLSLQSRNDPDDADAAIQDVRWINDKTIVFRAHVEDRPAQVYRIDVTGGRAIRLTREPLGVVSFDISADLRRVLYVTPVPNPAVRHGARSVVVGAQSFWSVNFPQAGLRTQQRWYRYVVAEAGSRAPPRTLGGKFAESSSGRPAASLSPDGRWALVPRYEPGRQAAWAEQYPEVAEATEKYGPSAKLDPLGYYSRPFSYVPRRLVAYRLKDGKEHLVVDSPDDSLPGNQSRGDRLWMQTGASVVIAGTYLPRASGASKDKSGSHIIEYWPDSGKWKDIAALDGRLTGALRAEGRGDAFIAIDGKQRRRFERKTDGAWFEQPDIDRGSDIEAVALRVDESLNRPADIAATMPNGESVRLTHLNPQFSSATWGSIQPYDWKDAKGRTWRGGLMTPAVLDAKTRHALVIQPYGFSASRFYLDGANTYTGFTSGFAGRAFMRENILVLALPWSSVGSEEMAEHEGIVSFSEGVRSAIDAERERILEHGFVAIRRREVQRHLVPSGDLHAADLAVFGRGAREVADRSDPAQNLFHGIGEQVGLRAEVLPLVGVLAERDQTSADRVARRLVAGLNEQLAVPHELGLGEGRAVDPSADQLTHQIVGGHATALLDQLREVGVELAPGTPRDFAEYIVREIPKWAKVVKDSGARAE